MSVLRSVDFKILLRYGRCVRKLVAANIFRLMRALKRSKNVIKRLIILAEQSEHFHHDCAGEFDRNVSLETLAIIKKSPIGI